MAECSGSRFKPLDKPIEEFITDRGNKNTRAKTQREVKLLTAFLPEKTNKEKLKKFNQKSSTATLLNLLLVWKEKMAKTINHQAFEGCFQVSRTSIQKNARTQRVLSKTLCLIKQENAWKLAANNWKKKEKGTNPTQLKLWLMWRKTFFTKRIYSESQMPKLC